MQQLPYLADLTIRLAEGLETLPEEFREQVATFLLSKQQPDGGFPGRANGSDLYYTSFALRSLALLGKLEDEPAERTCKFLQEKLNGQEPLVDLLSLIFSANLLENAAGMDVFANANQSWREYLANNLKTLRRPDGGFAKTIEGSASSTYFSFLVAATMQLIEEPISEPEQLAKFAKSQQREDGGFVEIRVMRSSGVNPTSAAYALLKILSEETNEPQLNEESEKSIAKFLAARQSSEGGFAANTRIPIADLLSTFTGMLTLANLDALGHINTEKAKRFAQSLVQPDGGFFAAAWDEQTDVEYTFYGLGTLALLNRI